MSQPLPDALPEVFVSSSSTSRAVGRMVRAGTARKIGPRLYTWNVTDSPEVIVRRNLWRVIGLLMPGVVVGYRTAFRVAPSVGGSVFVVGNGRQTLELPGHRVQVIPGPGPLEGDQPLQEGVVLASRPRAILESLRLTRRRKHDSRGVSRAAIGEYLEHELRAGGEARLERIRDEARALAPHLDAEKAFRALGAIMDALLSERRIEDASPEEREHHAPAAPVAAPTEAEPSDAHRVELFQALHAALGEWLVRPRPDRLPVEQDFAHLAFFDAYFSNLIEGNEFEVGEAHAIVFGGHISQTRPQETHDVLATFHLVGSRAAMSRGLADAASPEEYVTRVRAAHAQLMAARADKRPGEFRAVTSEAGHTTFVQPELVPRTLLRGIEIARSLAAPFARAALLMFVLTEVHPFDDGNGRLSRALMNAELISGGERRILIPIDRQGEYLTGLGTLSQTGDPEAYLQFLDRAQEYTAAIDFTDYHRALAVLRETNAFEGPPALRHPTLAPAQIQTYNLQEG